MDAYSVDGFQKRAGESQHPNLRISSGLFDDVLKNKWLGIVYKKNIYAKHMLDN